MVWKKYPLIEEKALHAFGNFGEAMSGRVHAAESKIFKLLHHADKASNGDGKLTVNELIAHLPVEDEEAADTSNTKLLIGIAAAVCLILIIILVLLYFHHKHALAQRPVKGKGKLTVTSVQVLQMHKNVQEVDGMKTVTVMVKNCKHLQSVDSGFAKASDPKVKILCGTEVMAETPAISNNLDPVFDCPLTFNWKVGTDILFQVWDVNSLKKDKPMGQCKITQEELGHLYWGWEGGDNMKLMALDGSKPKDDSTLSVSIKPGGHDDHASAKEQLKGSLSVGKDVFPLAVKKDEHATWTTTELCAKGKPHLFSVDFDAKPKKPTDDTKYLKVTLDFAGRHGEAAISIGEHFAHAEGEQHIRQTFSGQEAGMIEVRAVYTPDKPPVPASLAAKAKFDKAAADKAAAAKAAAAKAAPKPKAAAAAAAPPTHTA